MTDTAATRLRGWWQRLTHFRAMGTGVAAPNPPPPPVTTTAAPWGRPITEDFYRSPSGEWVYRWSDERLVLKEGPTDAE